MNNTPQKQVYLYDPVQDAYVRKDEPQIMLRQSDYNLSNGAPCLEYHNAGRVFRLPCASYEANEKKGLDYNKYVFLRSVTWEGNLPLSDDDRKMLCHHLDEAVESHVSLRWFDDNGASPHGARVIFSKPNFILYENVKFFPPGAYFYREGRQSQCRVYKEFRPYRTLIGYDSQLGAAGLSIYLSASPLYDTYEDLTPRNEMVYSRPLTVDEKLVIAADISAALKVRNLGPIQWMSTMPSS